MAGKEIILYRVRHKYIYQQTSLKQHIMGGMLEKHTPSDILTIESVKAIEKRTLYHIDNYAFGLCHKSFRKDCLRAFGIGLSPEEAIDIYIETAQYYISRNNEDNKQYEEDIKLLEKMREEINEN